MKPAPRPPVVPWRRARNADKALVERILLADRATSMLALDNLREHGLDGLAPRALHVWLNPDETGLVALTNNGTLLPQCPRLRPGDGLGLRLALAGSVIRAVIGPDAQLRGMIKALGLDHAVLHSYRRQPGFALPLAALKMPDTAGLELRRTHVNDRPLMRGWRAAYLVEVRGLPLRAATDQAAGDVDGFLASRQFRILMQGARAVAMTGLTARHGDTVQVGGVFTPPECRRRGLARAAVALHLAEARDQGVTQAVLFAASEPAARAYRALGFRPASAMGLAFFRADQTVDPPPEDHPR